MNLDRACLVASAAFAAFAAFAALGTTACHRIPKHDILGRTPSESSSTSVTSAELTAGAEGTTATETTSAAPGLPPLGPTSVVRDAHDVSLLATSGMTISPPFRYTLSAGSTDWTVENESRRQTIHLMRKWGTPAAQVGVVPCRSRRNGAGRRQADGSLVYRCFDGSAFWFARAVRIDDGNFQSLLCLGSSRDARALGDIERACRSIRRRS